MARAMYVNVVDGDESRIAIVDGGLLEELSIETSRDELIEGNIYKARVEKVVPGLDAVFVDYGRERNGFLALSEVRQEYFVDGERKAENLKRGRELIVQVKKGEIGQKGAALTTYVSIPGRYLVLMPYVDKRGVSRQIEDDETRKLLKEAIGEAALPEGMGYIVRTAAGDQKKQDIQRDVTFLLRLWKRIQTMYEKAKGPALVYREGDIVIRTIRDYFSPEMKELLIDDPAVHERVAAFFRAVMPWHAKKVQLYEGRAPLFSKHNLEAQIASIYEEKVKLPSGGSIVIQQTEALVSVDVNSGGGSRMKDIEETALRTNLEAAAEVGRQLRLRDMGGLIVIDFIDMRSQTNQGAVKKELQKALKSDKARTDIGAISKFGLLELSRQRLRRAAAPKLTATCHLCQGSGKLLSTDTFSLQVLRIVHLALAKGVYRKAGVGVPPETASYLYNRKRKHIKRLEELFGATVNIFAEPTLQANQYYLDLTGEKNRYETNLPQGARTDLLLCRKPWQDEDEAITDAAASYGPMEDENEEVEEPTGLAGEPATVAEEDETEPAENAETAQDSAEGQSTGRKRRRKRRRRKKSGQSLTAEETQPAGEENNQEIASELKAPVTDTEEPKSSEEAEEPPAAKTGQPRKSRRRGRRRGRGKANAEIPGEQASEPVRQPEQAAEPTESAAPQNKRTGRRRRPRKKKPQVPTSE